MADFDSLIKGMQMFNQGMTKFASTRAINQAQDEIAQLNTMEMDEAKKRQQMNMISQNLSMQLTKSGADPALAENMLARGETRNKMDWQSKENSLDRANQLKIAQMNVEAQAVRRAATFDDKEVKRLETLQGRFNSAAKKQLEALDMARTAQDILASENPIGDQAVSTFMARASTEVGNLTEAERAPYGSAQDIKSRLSQIAQKYTEGTLTPENRQYISDLAKVFTSSAKKAAGKHAERLAKQGKAILPGREETEIRKALYADDLEENNDPMIEAAKKWIADPKNKTHKNYENVKKKLGL